MKISNRRNKDMLNPDHLFGTNRAFRGALAVTCLAAAALAGGPAAAQAPIVYPSQGQSMERQARDEGECRMWAQQQTGFNPSQGPVHYGSSSQASGQVVGGAARGALLGVVGGAIGGDAGKGAAIGAGVGATAGLMRRGRQRRAQEQVQSQAVADYNRQVAQYNRAFGTCMQGRGYAVN